MIVKKLINKRIFQNIYKCLLKKKGLSFGNNCEFGYNITWGTEPYLIKMGNNCRVTQNVSFITHDGSVWVIRNMYNEEKNIDKFGEIIIGDNVNIGWNSIIMPNIIIGDNVIIGAGSVVTKSIPSNTVVAGVPARTICSIEEYYKKNKNCFYDTKQLNKREKKRFILENIKKNKK